MCFELNRRNAWKAGVKTDTTASAWQSLDRVYHTFDLLLECVNSMCSNVGNRPQSNIQEKTVTALAMVSRIRSEGQRDVAGAQVVGVIYRRDVRGTDGSSDFNRGSCRSFVRPRLC
jgi:hypothetical protein